MLRNVNVSHNLRDDLSPEMRERFLNKIINPSMSKLMTKKIKQQMGRKSPSLKRSIGNSSALLPPAHHVRHNRDLEIPDIKDNYRTKNSMSQIASQPKLKENFMSSSSLLAARMKPRAEAQS